MSETSLNCCLDRENDRLKIESYNFIRSGNSSGLKKGGACIYYNEYIPLIRRDDLCSLSNCLITEIYLEMKGASLLVSTDHLVKISTSLKIFLKL